MKNARGFLALAALVAASAMADVAGYAVSDVRIYSQLPWDTGIDISFTVTPPEGGTTAQAVELDIVASNGVDEVYISDAAIISRLARPSGRQHLVWRPDIDHSGAVFGNLKMYVSVKAEVMERPPYMFVKLNDGEIGYAGHSFTNAAKKGFALRDYMVFRYIPPTTSAEWKKISGGDDSFWFGMPAESAGAPYATATDKQREDSRHRVKLTKGFYMGVVPVTRGQMAMLGFRGFGVHTSTDSLSGENYRVAMGITYEQARGADVPDAYDYPRTDEVDPNSIVGRMRSLTGLRFDLPTSFQWEYAARAGSTNSYLHTATDRVPTDQELTDWFSDPTPTNKPENRWGLYGLIGCCHQWTLTLGRMTNTDGENNFYLLTEDATDPTGPYLQYSNGYRITRGSHWLVVDNATKRRVYRIGYKYPLRANAPAELDLCGVRLCLPIDP